MSALDTLPGRLRRTVAFLSPRPIAVILLDLQRTRRVQDAEVVTPRPDPFTGGSLFTDADRHAEALERELEAAFLSATGMTLAAFEEARL